MRDLFTSGAALILASPASGSGKTTITLGLLRALSRLGIDVAGAKSGPDYIDPQFHEAACGRPSPNLDAWAMNGGIIGRAVRTRGLRLIEGAMGLFDGAPPDGRGATADLARMLRLPVILIVDAARMSHSVAPLVAGFASHDPHVRVAGIILNRTGSDRHAAMLRRALAPLGIPVLGHLPRDTTLSLPSRHLGLVQAQELPGLDAFIDRAADLVAAHINMAALISCAAPLRRRSSPLCFASEESIAVARDAAFSFVYNHQLASWHGSYSRVQYFSPLADDPVPRADRVFLPGGYPELHAPRLAAATTFLRSLRAAAETTPISGECGGYMVLGNTLTDAEGTAHRMAGLLDLDTSFATRRLHLGYRTLIDADGTSYAGHEFHYATTLREEGTPLYRATDAEGTDLPPMGLVRGHVSGSFAHIIWPV